MHASTHAGAQVGGAGVDVAVLGVQHEVPTRLLLYRIADSLDASGQAVENAFHITTRLHGDDPQLVLLVDPSEEGFALLWKIPRPSGQSLSMPATFKFRSPDMKRK